MYYDQIMSSLRRDSPRSHTPRFRLAREANAWRVYDGEHALAVFYPQMLDIWSFSPFEPDEMANPEPPGKVVDLHTLHNTCLNFGAQTWPPQWAGLPVSWTWVKEAGPELQALVRVDGPEGESCSWRLTIGYDPAWARYRYTFAIAARKRDPDGFECLNLMTAGALEDRPEKRRWTHSVWENPDGELRRVVHSNVLFHCTDFGGFRHGGGPWRGRHLPYPRAWMAYAAHPSFNPAYLVHRTTVPLLAGTCSQLFDEHLVWNHAGQDNLESDGYFHYYAEMEFVNLPPALAQDFLARATDPVHPTQWWHETVALPFRMDVVNSFEEALDPWLPEDCPIIEIHPARADRVTWANCGHTGARSIRLSNDGTVQRTTLFPTGAVCKVRPHTRYRLGGWVRTEAVQRYARLVLYSYEYTYGNVVDTAASAHVAGVSDWTRVEAVLDSGDEAYIMPVMELYGPGQAWFDDLTLAPVEL